jgi:hypothetical protein
MTRDELKEKIKILVKQVYQPKPIDIDSDKPISLETEKFPILLQFPSLKKVLVDLLTKQFEIFISDIQWVAPKPTTFRIVLGNGENFMLIWMQRSWVANVEGKRYYLLNLNEEENAISAIARILSYGSTQIEDPAAPADTSVDTGGGDFPGGEGGGGETETGDEETQTDITATDTEEV